MSYSRLYESSNEFVKERLELVMERIGQIADEKAASVGEAYREYFTGASAYLLVLDSLAKKALSGELAAISETEGAALNGRLYADVQNPGYETSYANPAYAVANLGEAYGQILAMLADQFHRIAPECAQGNLQDLCLFAELFVEIFNCFEDEEELSEKELKNIVYSFMHDNTEVFEELKIRRLVMPEYDYEQSIVMDEEMQAMADTFTEGFRIGFATCNKDISLKSMVEIRYPMGFERMIRFAIRNFEAMGLKSVLRPFSISENKQYVYDHREDRGLWLDKPFIERVLEADRNVWEKLKDIAPGYGGPAVIDTFGTEPFAPEQKPQNVKFTDRQQ